MDYVPYRNKALQQKRKKEKQVYVVELHIPRWLPILVVVAVAGKCSHMIIKRVAKRINNKEGKRDLQEGDMKKKKKIKGDGKRSNEFKDHHLHRLKHSCTYNYDDHVQALDGRRTVSMPVYRSRSTDADSAKEDSSFYYNDDDSFYNEDSLSEFSRIPSPREREDEESSMSQFELYESCYEDYLQSPYSGSEYNQPW
eukprot:TRINITY_DN2239_c1_g1_i1.p3 TRINITY_DN2239_c1_g1~~TRINITY_DN2239_c1_g1_i1.p3  ORF type:complete len:197 (-),score=17.10 TRINITY_DN2239_c1_g1_i1:960-1550(-)